MKRLLLPLALAATAALLWQSVTPALACSCSFGGYPDVIEAADTIVVGTLDSIEVIDQGQPYGIDRVPATLLGIVEVGVYLKGTGPRTIAVREFGGAPGTIDTCSALLFEHVGREYWLFLEGSESPYSSGGACAGSFVVVENYEPFGDPLPGPILSGQSYTKQTAGILALTGQGVVPNPPDSAPTVPLAIAAVALPLVFVLAASFVFPARGSRP